MKKEPRVDRKIQAKPQCGFCELDAWPHRLMLLLRKKVSVKVEAEGADGLNEMRFNMSSRRSCLP